MVVETARWQTWKLFRPTYQPVDEKRRRNKQLLMRRAAVSNGPYFIQN